MKTLQLLLFTTFIALFGNTQDLLTIQGDGKLIADFNSTYEKPNVKGFFLDKHLTLVSVVEGTKVVKCQVRIGGMVNLIGIWELNDLNDVLVKVYEVQIEEGITDILLVSFADNKAIQMNLFRLNGEELMDLGYNYFEQKNAGEPITIFIEKDAVRVSYDKGTENPRFGIVKGTFIELPQ